MSGVSNFDLDALIQRMMFPLMGFSSLLEVQRIH
jgi:hypothetical protein